jgi:hypothetical protein
MSESKRLHSAKRLPTGTLAARRSIGHRERLARRGATIGCYSATGLWVTVELHEHEHATAIVELRQRAPDEPDAGVLLVAVHATADEAAMAAEARVLARGGRLDTEAEQLAESPVRGGAAERLRRGAPGEPPLELDGRDSRPVPRSTAHQLLGGQDGRFRHVRGGR